MAANNTLGFIPAICMGIIQGLTEFLPVSSSGHLALAGHFGLGVANPLFFDAYLHMATLLVVVLHFRQDLADCWRRDRWVIGYILLATFPTAVIGFTCQDYFKALRQSPTMIALGLLVISTTLSLADLVRGGFALERLGKFGAFFLGLCQALALAPGISRSGITISGAILCGVERKKAFRFSFLLAIPAIAGAVGSEGLVFWQQGGEGELWRFLFSWVNLAAFAVTAGVGYLSLRLLGRLVEGGKLSWFAAYCFLLAMLVLVYFNYA
ncbi:MAG: undecaprenyl-diphosphate phosphatase [Planctomycetota bacterium]|jgi:undecaprenyl-diphosphatase|nr:undecaprenyl-diphosphate phosphatase [Planctomycetota bacterium]